MFLSLFSFPCRCYSDKGIPEFRASPFPNPCGIPLTRTDSTSAVYLKLRTLCADSKCPYVFQKADYFSKYLRAHDCKYRESLARIKKSKILIICQKNPFGQLPSKKFFQLSRIYCFRENEEKRK